MNERVSGGASYAAHVGAAAACLVRASSCAEALGASGLFDGLSAFSDRMPSVRNRAVGAGERANEAGAPAGAGFAPATTDLTRAARADVAPANADVAHAAIPDIAPASAGFAPANAGGTRAKAPDVVWAAAVPDGAESRALALVVYANGPADAFSERFPAESLFFVEDLHPSAFEAAPVPEFAQALWLVPALSARDLRIADVRAFAAAAHAHGALLALDVSATTSYCSAAFELGADLCLERLDMDGECDASDASDIALFHIGLQPRWALSVARPRRKRRGEAAAELNRLRIEIARALGGAPDACEPAVLLERDARTQRRCDHARALAEYLSCCDAVPAVVYPGLPTHPDHALAAQALRHGAGFVLDFEVPAPVRASAFIARAARHRARPGTSGAAAAGAAASDSRSSEPTAAVPAVRTVPVAGAAPASGSPCACEPLAAGAPPASEPDARTQLLARDGADGRFVRLVAGLDNPLAIADDLDQALRWFCNPPEP